MRSIWKGTISFGLVTIPVKLYSATEERDVSFHQVHRADGGRIKYKRVCSVDGEEVTYGDIAKGYALPTGETVILTDEDLADLPLTSSRTIDVLQFVPLEQVDPIYFAKSYYLEPDRTGNKPYVLLRDALQESGRVAVVKVALRQREQLATLRVRDGVFVLETMLWPDEIRTPDFPFLDDDVQVRPQELAMAGSLIESLADDFAPSEFSDGYRAALQAVIDAKIEGREMVAPAAQDSGEGGAVVDLMAALRASVEAAKSKRGEQSGGGGLSVAKAAPDETLPEPEPAKESAKKVPRSTKQPVKRSSQSKGSAGAAAAADGTADSPPAKAAKRARRSA